MKKVILVTLIILAGITSYAQNDSSKNVVRMVSEPKSEMIAKSRRILLDQFVEKNFYGVMSEMEYLMNLDDEDYIALYPQEFWLLSYWMKDYQSILRTVESPESAIANPKIKRIPPQNDYLTIKIIEKTKESESSLIDDIAKSSLDAEEKKFLTIHLKFLAEDIGFTHPRQNELNVLADEFLNNYPSGNYSNFVRKYVRVKYEPTSSGLGYSLHAGTLLFTANLKNYFNNPTFIGMGIDALRSKWLFQLNIGFAIGKTKSDMPVNDVIWPSGSKTFGGHIDLAAGYCVVNNEKIGIAPFASVGIFGLPSNANMDKQPELKEAGIKTNVAGTFGFMTDIKLKTKTENNLYQFTGPSANTTSLRLTYGYIATTERNKYVDLSGSVHKITLGIGIMGRKHKRVE